MGPDDWAHWVSPLLAQTFTGPSPGPVFFVIRILTARRLTTGAVREARTLKRAAKKEWRLGKAKNPAELEGA